MDDLDRLSGPVELEGPEGTGDVDGRSLHGELGLVGDARRGEKQDDEHRGKSGSEPGGHSGLLGFRGQIRSRIVAVARAPPQHMLTIAMFRSARSSSWRAVVISRLPVQPTGCPRAMAPPLTFTLSMSG